MKNVKRLIALVLCAVMLFGLAPVAFDNKIIALDNASEVDAVVQGPNDAVVIYDVDLVLREAFNAFVGNKVLVSGGNTVGVGGTTSGAAFDRIIFVMAISDRLGAAAHTALEGSTYKFTDCENIVITSKCYAEYTDNVFMYTGSTYDSLMGFDAAKAAGKSDPFTDNLIDKTDSVVFRLIENGAANYIRMACDVSFEYITLKFDANVLFYLCGYDFSVSDTVKFEYVGTTTGYKPIIVNGGDGSNMKFDSDKTQTVTLNGGDYQYVVFRSRNTIKNYSGYDLTLNLGEVSLIKNNGANENAFFSNDVFENTTLTVNIDGTTFATPVYLVQGGTNSNASAPSITNCTLNVNVKSADFQKGIVPYITSESQSACTVNSLDVNMHIDSCSIGNGFTIEGQTDAIAAAVDASIEYPEGALFASSIANFDSTRTFTGNLCAQGHTFTPALNGTECGYSCFYCGEVDETKVVSFETSTGYPMIYLDYTNGSNANDGLTKNTAVKNLWKACEILSAWQRGGYVVVVGNAIKLDTHTTDANSVSCTMLVDVGGTLYVDGNYNDEKGEGARATLTSNSGFVYFENETVFRNIELYSTTNAKNWVLNYNSFYANENCSQSNTENYNLTLFAGALNNTMGDIAKYATDRVVDQEIIIDGFCFQSIMMGSKSVQKDKSVTGENPNGEYCVRYSREYSVNCSGLSTLYIGMNSKVDSINVRKHHYNSETGLVGKCTAPDVRIHIESVVIPDAGIKFVQNNTHLASTRVYTTADGPDKNMFADDRALIIYGDDFSDIASVLTVWDLNRFDFVSEGFKEGTDAAIRVTFAENENSMQAENIDEFGVLFTTSEAFTDLWYVDVTGAAVNGIAKSLAYDKAKGINNYCYDGVNPAYFHGVIEFGDLDRAAYYDLQFAAHPYAVVAVPAADGLTASVAAGYTVIGLGSALSFGLMASN